ncbi:MAG TPA: PilZ domain-containing protein [Croceibacterium sp.]|nr:PilZ domain-containing protein [Croceibacterium sp.]
MTDPPSDDDGVDPRRAYSRLRVGIDASLDTLDGRQKVRLIDLSRAGAHVVLSQPETIREGVLRWLRFDTFGIAMWQAEDDVGLKFDRLLPLRVLDETRERAPAVVLEMAQAWVTGNLADD